MCDASYCGVGAVLGQRRDKKPFVIYYTSKMLDEAQLSYSTTNKEMVAVIFVIEKILPISFRVQSGHIHQPLGYQALDGKEGCQTKVNSMGICPIICI